MNIKYLFVVSLILFFLLPKNIYAQDGFDIDLMSIDDYSNDNNLTTFEDDGDSYMGEMDDDQQIITTNARTLQNASPTRGIYTDDFRYRWYIQGGVGAQFLMGEDDSKGKFQSRMTIAPSLTAGYRFNPVFGVRLNLSGGSLHGFNDGHSGTYRFWKGKSADEVKALSGENGFPADLHNKAGYEHWDPQWNYMGFTEANGNIVYDTDSNHPGYNWAKGGPKGGLYMQHIRYATANAALTMNFFNLFGGADDSRKFDVSLHAGPTFFHVFPHQGQLAYNGIGVNGGIQAQYHATDRIGIFAEFNGLAMPDGFDGHLGGDTFDLIGQALLGVSYKFPSDRWAMPKLPPRVQTMPETDDMNDELNRIRAELMAEMNQMVDLQPEIDRLRAQLAAIAVTEVVEEEPEPDKVSFFHPSPLHFAIGKTDIDAQGWAVVEEIAAYLNTHPDASVIITGYADKDTGTDAINERLSRERSKKVADALQYRYNIPQGRIAINWQGDSVQPFSRNQMNRAVLFWIEFD